MLIEKARELGMLIAASPEFKRMNCARQAVAAHEALQLVLDELASKQERLVSCLEDADEDASLAVELTDDIERLREQLKENPLIQEMMTAQEKFSALLSSINAEINACIGLSTGCTHDCTSCSGCVH